VEDDLGAQELVLAGQRDDLDVEDARLAGVSCELHPATLTVRFSRWLISRFERGSMGR
jgi:hypothetical protein